MSIVDLQQFTSYVDSQLARDQELLQLTVGAAEAWVNQYCGRQFVVASSATARTFPATDLALLDLPDFTSVSSVSVGGIAVSGLLYEPAGGGYDPTGVVLPYTGLWGLNGASYWYPAQWGSALYPVAVTATWGWAEIPAPVKAATMMVAKDILSNKNVSFGIVGFSDYAGIRAKENPQVSMLLAPYRRASAIVGIA